MNEIQDTLECVEELLTPPEAWTKGKLARTASGSIYVKEEGQEFVSVITPKSPQAASFCLVGAVMHCAPEENGEKLGQIGLACVKRLAQVASERVDNPDMASYGGIVTHYNDGQGRTHEEILALVRETRERVA